MENELKPRVELFVKAKTRSSWMGETDAKILPHHDRFFSMGSCNMPGCVMWLLSTWCVGMRLDCDLCCKYMNEESCD